MARRRRKQPELDSDSTFELDLAPMLALMVTLIPVMLLSTAFVKVKVIETALPQVVEKALKEDRNKKDRQISVDLSMSKRRGFYLKVLVDGRVRNKKRLSRQNGQWNLEGLHKELVRVKRKFPKTFRLNLTPAENVPYDDIVKVMDAARRTNDNDPEIYLQDEEKGKKVKVELMFPDVVFSNVVEG